MTTTTIYTDARQGTSWDLGLTGWDQIGGISTTVWDLTTTTWNSTSSSSTGWTPTSVTTTTWTAA